MKIGAILLDMDGVLYHGDRALPGAVDFVRSAADIPHCFLTNNPILPPEEIAEKLQNLGFARPDPRFIVTSAEATAQWLQQRKPRFRYFAVGAGGLHRALARYGVEDRRHADFVVVGEGPGLDYESLTQGINLILQRGAGLIATNPDCSVDAVHHGRHRVLPGGGALVAAFSVAAHVAPQVIGKPHPLLYQMAMERLGVGPQNCLMIGDRPDTDVLGAVRLGISSALVRTGRFMPGAAWPVELPLPDYDTADLAELSQCLGFA